MTMLPVRLQRLTQALDTMDLDAMLVTDEINVRYLSGFTGDSSYLLVTPTETTILSDGRYEAQIAAQCQGLGSRIRSPSQLLADLAQAALNDLSPGGRQRTRVGVEADHLSMTAFRTFNDRVESIDFVATSGAVEQLRMIKDEQEVETTRQAVRIAERALLSLLPMLSPDWSERQIAHELEAKMRFLGAEGCSFAPIVAAGPAGCCPTTSPRRRNWVKRRPS